MHPVDADFYGVQNGGFLKLRIGGDCAVAFENVLVRVNSDFKLEVHMDTDEGNACNMQSDTPGELIKQD